ncbi:MAG: bifunctional response regulator/alkaline phosphatase family protein [Candidatus Eisenbacteria bacterium]|uniref:Bifunctional response regulator/alkaline phosphatase family protein n=1 Tax=Eiseniibacteriota bacterium TaxID=2212470 RepID=A0A948RUA2_UNCEI|nr:bifunctional response regulator/alkaline phosphatase family protein [Candidatus Eisenbacteria bacterium]MBU1949273.1 bifunctional response regulator/alkaline phosphatase family protein [Candidatus Eisenbacteria bacterium]MBU2689683.1 bifunctional response regulator/alkaline phosphatase family protein [Candidatus Eisenbacteria bacterium]
MADKISARNETRRILWVDDEIDLLRPHILYLEGKGYEILPSSNALDALDLISREPVDLVLLDEMMPGMDGLAMLDALKGTHPYLPVIMITKSEEEDLMDRAIGRRITDYLIKPVNPSQIWMACKKVFERREIVKEQRVRGYVQDVAEIRSLSTIDFKWDDWAQLYYKMVRWDLELLRSEDSALRQAHQDYISSLNVEFCRYVEVHYRGWVDQARGERPPFSNDLVEQKVMPLVKQGKKVSLIVIDCMRLDQWLVMEPLLTEMFHSDVDLYCSILPTATPYSRNAIFSGLFPIEIARRFPEYWQEAQNTETSKNRYEQVLLKKLLERNGVRSDALRYLKIYNRNEALELSRQLGSIADLSFSALVFTFVDALSHGRSQSELLQELAPDEDALRSHLRTWFSHSILMETLRTLSERGVHVVITTDHGSVQVKKATRVRANRETSSGVRYKYGDNLVCDERTAIHVRDPQIFKLPLDGLVKHYILAKENYFFLYPNNFRKYERLFRNSFQHGGVSLEEMILPVVTLTPRNLQ